MTAENIESAPIEQPIVEADEKVNGDSDFSEVTAEESGSESLSSPEAEENEGTSIDDLPLPGDEKEEKNDLPKWAKKRIEKKERLIEQAAAEAAAYKAENERLRSAQFNSPVSQANDIPNRDDFDTEYDYFTAVTRHVNNRDLSRLQNEKALRDTAEQEKTFLDKWNDSEIEGLKKYEDFDEKFNVLKSKSMPGNRMMAQAVLDSPHKIDLLQFLGTYPEKAREIALKDPIQAIKDIAKLELRFSQRQNTKVVKSPKIISPVKGNKGAEGQVDPNNLNPDEYRQWYEARKKARR